MSNQILELRKFVAPEFVFGVGARMQCGSYAQKLGLRNVLVVSDPGVIAAGWTADVISSLKSFNISTTLFSSITENPKDFEVSNGASVYIENQCDGIVAIGGGSPIDCAKGIAILVTNSGSILDYEGVDTVYSAIPPLICIPTTSGSAADVSQFAIITDTQRLTKIAIISKMIVPDVALIDPETTTSMNSFLTACTGMDTLTHAIEAYVSNANSPITDLHAEKGIEMIYKYLHSSIESPHDLKYREKVTFGCLEAGLAFSNASLGAVHAMAHSLGGFKNLPHGECNAILLEHVMAFNHSTIPHRFNSIAKIFDIDIKGMSSETVKTAVISEIRSLREQVGISVSLSDLGIRASDTKDLAEKAYIDPCLITNPREANLKDIEVLYNEAL